MRTENRSETMKRIIAIKIYLLSPTLLISNQVYCQSTLERKFDQIADTIKGNIGISALHIETGESISFNGDEKFPMQSVYKFPIAMVMLHEIDNGKFSLDDTIEVHTRKWS